MIHGDGLTEAGTFFTINERALNIYNMSNIFVKSVRLGPGAINYTNLNRFV